MTIANRALLLAVIGMAVVAATPGRTASVESPPTRGLYLQLIHQARADGRARAAIAYLDDFDRQFPGDVDARLLRVNSLLDLGQIDQADAVTTTLMRMSGNGAQTAAINAVRGHVFAARGKWIEAVPCYEQAVTGNPTEPLFRNALGYALLRAHRPERAIETLRGAADLAPSDEVIRNNLLLAYAVGGQKDALAQALGRIADRRSQAELPRQVAAEAVRLADPTTPPAVIADKKGR